MAGLCSCIPLPRARMVAGTSGQRDGQCSTGRGSMPSDSQESEKIHCSWQLAICSSPGACWHAVRQERLALSIPRALVLLKTPIRLFDSDPVDGRLELPVLPIH
ncbi:hypothetical protein C4K39_3207 [Pseudomonas sessilinigenes]|nr:hypothetical protein C4K39_3207 [Pseudomonas sessilinigenes]